MSRFAHDPVPFASRVTAVSQRWSLWAWLVGLVVVMLSVLVWLAGRHESSLLQAQLEQNALDAATDIRTGLARNAQALQALPPVTLKPEAWQAEASDLLRRHRELARIEWRNAALQTAHGVDTPHRTPVFAQLGRQSSAADVSLACSTARRFSGSAYSTSYFLPQSDGRGLEVIDMCLPMLSAGEPAGYIVATYVLQDILGEMVSQQASRGVGLSFTEADGTRLAMLGLPPAGRPGYIALQLLDLPGNTLVVRLESRPGAPALFPNVLTALVTAMSLALLAVLFLLARDIRRRQKVEHDLGEALAFRKAMEDSVSTGLRARDLQGRITYVNPAFCAMVGVDARDLLDQSAPSPYWPPELAGVYLQRQQGRLAGQAPPSGGHESIFMRADGTRFPVLIMEAPLINAVGKHTGWMSAILDVSEQRRIEELSRTSADRLQATARLAMVGEMASLLSHELNQPLAAISSYAAGSLNLLQGGDASLQGLQDDLQLAMRRIAGEAERAGKVIKSVNDVVRRRERVRERVAPSVLLDAILPLMRLQASKLGVRVMAEVDAPCEEVLCDRTMVEQVLLNLSRNGMQAMHEQPAAAACQANEKVLKIEIRNQAGAAGRWLAFSVTDCGDGITDDVAAQLFTPFFTTKVEGMGLGLSLCRTVIEQHGGALTFEAAAPRGTRFTFTLPAAVTRLAERELVEP